MAKICILIPGHWDAAKGGSEYQAHCLAEYLATTTGHEIIYLARELPARPKPYPYRLQQAPKVSPSYRYGLFWDTRSLTRALEEMNPDIVIQRLASAYTAIGARYCRRHGKPFIWFIASDSDLTGRKTSWSPTNWPRKFDAWLAKRSIRSRKNAKDVMQIIAQTSLQADILRRRYGREAAEVIPNFHAVPEKTWTKPATFTVLWIANFKAGKRPEIFLQLARDLESHTDIEFKMIGRVGDGEWERGLLSAMQGRSNFAYLGEMDFEAVNLELERAHVLINTSTFEGFSNTFIQAWMREAPVLTLNVDPDGVIEKFNLGVHARSYENLRRSLLELYGDRAALEKIGQDARHFAAEHYSMRTANRIATLIDELLPREDAASRTVAVAAVSVSGTRAPERVLRRLDQ